MSKRSFTIVHVAAPGQKYKSKSFQSMGRYLGEPVSAAKKAFRRICKDKRIKGQCTLTITMKETTRGSDKSLYSYRLKRVKKAAPLVRTLPDGSEVVYKYDTTVTPLNKNSPSAKATVGRGRAQKNAAKPTDILRSLLKQ